MADEVFQIGFETTGDAEAAAAFERLKVEQRELQAQARALQAQLKKLEQGGQKNTTEFRELSAAYVQAREAAQQLGRQANGIAGGLRRQSQAASAASRSMVDTRRATKNAGREMGMMINSVGELGFMFGMAIPGMSQYGTQLAMMGGNAVQFGAALGPVGAAIGVVSGALPIAISALSDFLGATNSARQGVHDLRLEVRSTAEELNDYISTLQRVQRERALESRVAMGAGTGEEQQAFVQQAEQDLAAAEARIEAERDRQEMVMRQQGGFTVEQRRQNEERLAELTTARAEAQTEVERREQLARTAQHDRYFDTVRQLEEDAEESSSRSRSRSNDAERRALEEQQRWIAGWHDTLMQMEGEAADRRIAEEERANARIQDARNALAQWEREQAQRQTEFLAEQAGARARRELEAFSRNLDAQQQAYAEQQEQTAQHLRETAQITEGAWSSIGGSVMDLAGQSFKFIMEGAEGGGDAFMALLDQFLEATAIEYGIKALAEAANAIAAAARYDMAAAGQHLTAAGMHAAVAAATGIAGAAIQTPSVSAPSDSGSSGAPQPTGAGAGGGPTQNITVQLFAPQAVFTEAERGEILERGLREARRSSGVEPRF